MLQTVQPVPRRRDSQMLYLMGKPPAAEARRIDQLCRQYQIVRQYDWLRLHYTLVPFGDARTASPAQLAAICAAAASLHAEPFTVRFDRISGNRLVGSGTAALRRFQRALVARLNAFDVLLPDYCFDPHISLQYGDRQSRNIRVEPICWTVTEMLLINSVHGKGHELLDCWQLERRQGELPF